MKNNKLTIMGLLIDAMIAVGVDDLEVTKLLKQAFDLLAEEDLGDEVQV